MNTTVTIDKTGRLAIPREIRDELHLKTGDSLILETEGDQITLRPLHAKARLRRGRGVWIYHGNKPLLLEEANQIVREARQHRSVRAARRR